MGSQKQKHKKKQRKEESRENIRPVSRNKLLAFSGLTVAFPEKKNRKKLAKPVVDHVSFSVHEGEIVGLIGESGSGKTMLAKAVTGLLPREAKAFGEALFMHADKELVGLSPKERRTIMGEEIAMIFQEPMTSFNPVLTIGYQLKEQLIIHRPKMPDQEKTELVRSTCRRVGLADPEKLERMYPHELSGGMRQRAMIALALLLSPSLLIADEPTTALDVVLQAQILTLLSELSKERNMAVLFISHNMSLVRHFCQSVYVMHDGKLVEKGTPEQIFETPRMAYTKKLIASIPKGTPREDKESLWDEPLLTLSGFSVAYPEKKKHFWERTVMRTVVDQVSLTIRKGEMVGLVGQSGCGKSTLSKGILGIAKHTHGTMTFTGRRPQMVFQDPGSSLNPKLTVGFILSEPLRMQNRQNRKGNAQVLNREAIRQRVLAMLKTVGLTEDMADRYPGQLSGGQRQRVAIALCLISGADFIIADEPVSALDVTIQKQILDLMKQLQKRFGIGCLFISHDKKVIREMCHRFLFMENGKVREVSDEELKEVLNA